MNRLKPEPKYSNDDYSRFSAADFQELHGGRTFDEANYYDDVQSSIGGLDLEAAKDMGHNSFGARAGFLHGTDGEKVPSAKSDDLSIGEMSSELLRKNAAIDSSRILISVHEGDITLKGEIPDVAQKHKAEHCLRKIPGLGSIINELHIRSSL